MVLYLLSRTDDEKLETNLKEVGRGCIKKLNLRFFFNVLALFPFQTTFQSVMSERVNNLLLFLKVFRIYNALELLDYTKIMRQFR
jgi:hypothetical protein